MQLLSQLYAKQTSNQFIPDQLTLGFNSKYYSRLSPGFAVMTFAREEHFSVLTYNLLRDMSRIRFKNILPMSMRYFTMIHEELLNSSNILNLNKAVSAILVFSLKLLSENNFHIQLFHSCRLRHYSGELKIDLLFVKFL